MNSADRPEMGEWCKVKCKARRTSDGLSKVSWKKPHELAMPSVPIHGMYIGSRTVYNGTVHRSTKVWDEFEQGYLKVSDSIQMWLFVKNERSAPFYAFPEDVIREEK